MPHGPDRQSSLGRWSNRPAECAGGLAGGGGRLRPQPFFCHLRETSRRAWIGGFVLGLLGLNPVIAGTAAELIASNGFCLEVSPVPDGRREGEGEVIARPCDGGRNQRWLLVPERLRTTGGLCLDLTGFRAGSSGRGRVLVAAPCNEARSQRWWVTAHGIRNLGNYCLDLTDVPSASGSASGAKVVASPCAGIQNQQWSVRQQSSAASTVPRP